MKRHISYPSIEQFRNVVAAVRRRATFEGLTDGGEPIYLDSKEKPTIKFVGTIKLHGSNSGVSFNAVSGMWAQSNERIITPNDDNAGFAFFVQTKQDRFKKLIDEVAMRESVNLEENTITIYGEWAGKGIQKSVGICELEKSLFIFGVKVSPFNISKGNPAYWVSSAGLRDAESKIFNILDFKTFEIDIDFNNPHLVQNRLVEITQEVETECPVAKSFGITGVGEGVVWYADYKGSRLQFKVKGEKHQSSKIKKLVTVDVEKINSLKEFADYAVTESRYNQAIEKVFGSEDNVDIKKLGDFLKWIVNDVVKEESDTMAASGLEPKEVNKYISNKARELFLSRY